MINDIHVDLCFIGTDGFSNMTGPSTPSSSDAFLDRTIISHSDKKYILGDYTKFERSSLFKICDWSEITGASVMVAKPGDGPAVKPKEFCNLVARQ